MPTVQYKDIYHAIERKHPALVDFMKTQGKTFGQELVYQESEILMRTMESMNTSRIVILPLHDGLFVPRSKQWQARRIMREITQEMVGFPIPADTLDMYVYYTRSGGTIQRHLKLIQEGKQPTTDVTLPIDVSKLTDTNGDSPEILRRPSSENIRIAI